MSRYSGDLSKHYANFVVASRSASPAVTQARSMLVNVSRFKTVQAQVHEFVEAEFERSRTPSSCMPIFSAAPT